MATYLNPKDRFIKPAFKQEFLLDIKEESVAERLTVKELKQMCKDKGLTGYSKLKEAELIELLGL